MTDKARQSIYAPIGKLLFRVIVLPVDEINILEPSLFALLIYDGEDFIKRPPERDFSEIKEPDEFVPPRGENI